MSQALSLEIYRNGQLIERRTLSQDVVKIGKLKSSHLCLEDDAVARMHAVIEVSGSDVRVIDLGSSSGTVLNGRRVEKHDVLQSGDVLEFGPFRVQVGFTAVATAAPIGVAPAAPAPPAPMVPTMVPQAAMAAPAARAAAARPIIHIDASDVEVQDGSRVTEVVTMYKRGVVDVQHVGQVRSKAAQAPVLLVLGGAIFLAGAGVFAYDAAQDWTKYEETARLANEAGQPKPPEPGTGFAGFGIALALLGLVPFSLGVTRLGDRGIRNYTIGEGHHATFHAPAQGLPDRVAFPLVRGGDRQDFALQFTREMQGDVTIDGHRSTLAELAASGRASAAGSTYSFPIPAGAHCRVEFGELSFHVNSVARGRIIATKSEADKPFWLYNSASLAVIGSLLMLVHLIPDDMLEMSTDDLSANNRFVGYIHQPDDLPKEEPPPEQDNSDDEAGGEGTRHTGEDGKMGKPTSKNKAGLYAMKGPKDAAQQMARNFDADMMARNAGILGMMQQESGHFLASPFGGAFAVGNDDEDVWGGLTGTEIGEAYGVGGLGLIGIGRGAGGTGEGTIGMGNVGLIGKGGGGGTNSGYGRGSGAGFSDRGPRVPRVRSAKAEVHGAIDKDIIRRIVRAHINEVSACYNQGLVRDPNLRGRVSIQFTIGPSGSVPVAVVQESTMKDGNVGQCVAKAVKRWKFPKPDGGGNVVVTYPFVLETSGV
jgi:TonB family protein